MTKEEILDIIEMSKSELLPVTEKMFGVDLDYTEDSLKSLEEAINDIYPEGHQVVAPTTYVPFAVYLGEVIINSVKGAEWEIDDIEYLNDITINVPTEDDNPDNHATVYPFRRVEKFWKDRTDSLHVYACMIRMMANGELNEVVENAEFDEWIDIPNVGKMRMIRPWTQLI